MGLKFQAKIVFWDGEIILSCLSVLSVGDIRFKNFPCCSPHNRIMYIRITFQCLILTNDSGKHLTTDLERFYEDVSKEKRTLYFRTMIWSKLPTFAIAWAVVEFVNLSFGSSSFCSLLNGSFVPGNFYNHSPQNTYVWYVPYNVCKPAY